MQAGMERYARQMLLEGFGEEGQRALARSRAVLVGVGALGSHIADSLVRAGIGHLILADRDFIELNNLQRQALYDEDDLAANLPKAEAAARKLRRINSTVKVEARVMDVNPSNVESLISGADVVLDGTDNFATRYLLNDACVKHGIPWIYGGVLGTYGVTMTILPGRSPCLRCLFREMPPPGSMPTCDVAGILGPIAKVIGAFEASEAIKLLSGLGKPNPGLLTIDLAENHLEKVPTVCRAQECPTCGLEQYEFLQSGGNARAISLCGRDAVHVSVAGEPSVDLARLAERLRPVATNLAVNEFMLRFTVDSFEFTVFPDARAIIKGTQDEDQAKSLYARYIGA
ncbi:MAG: ThiF family adenylyltransferase [Anaerolineae bacterium]